MNLNAKLKNKMLFTPQRLDLMVELSGIDYELRLHHLYGSCPLAGDNCHEQLLYRKNEIKKLLGDKK